MDVLADLPARGNRIGQFHRAKARGDLAFKHCDALRPPA